MKRAFVGAGIDTLCRRLRYRGGRKARSAARRLRRGITYVHPSIPGGFIWIGILDVNKSEAKS